MGTIVGNENLRTLWDGLAAQCGSREFMHFFNHDGREETYTYEQFNNLINQTANYFLEPWRTAGRKRCRAPVQLARVHFRPFRLGENRRNGGSYEYGPQARGMRVYV